MAGNILEFGCNKKGLTFVFFILLAGLVYIIASQHLKFVPRVESLLPCSLYESTTTEHKMLAQNAIRYRNQRNNLSRQLNLMMKAYGQQNCEMLQILKASGKEVDLRVSENGGWCSAISRADSVHHLWDEKFSIALSTFLKGKTVASFGDGPGQYKKHLDSLGEVVNYTSYDGAPFCENVTDGLVNFLDLTAPQYGLPAYDWIISVEVGEHIPAKFENIFLDNLARHAKEGIILSWAVPGQPGLSHVNNQPLDHVAAQMNKRGFELNITAGQPLRDAATFPWLQMNVHVYFRKSQLTFIIDDA